MPKRIKPISKIELQKSRNLVTSLKRSIKMRKERKKLPSRFQSYHVNKVIQRKDKKLMITFVPESKQKTMILKLGDLNISETKELLQFADKKYDNQYFDKSVIDIADFARKKGFIDGEREKAARYLRGLD